MGATFVEVMFRGPQGARTLSLLVDTGAAYSVVPATVARELGGVPWRMELFELADGREITRPLGPLEVELLGRRCPTMVIFGEEKDGALLGLHALEGLGLEVDPVRREVRPVRASPWYLAAVGDGTARASV